VIELLRKLVRQRWPILVLSPLFGRYNPFHPDYRLNPYPTYARLREEAPIYRHPLFRIWILSRHADIQRVLKDPRFSVNLSLIGPTISGNPLRQMSERQIATIRVLLIFLDPPDHTRIRNLVSKAFSQRRGNSIRPHIQKIADERLDRLSGHEKIELMRDFAIPFPLHVITEMLGVPYEDLQLFKRWSTCLTTLFDPINGAASVADAIAAFDELDTYLSRLFESRKRHPRNDMVSALVAAHEEGDRLSELELLAVVSLILGAGNETVTNFIGNSIISLVRNPGELERLRSDPALIVTAVEELLRYDSPVQATQRVLTEDAEIDGVYLRKGSVVLCLLGSANHDSTVFENPQRLDLGRAPNPHLAFSHGAHFCLGAQLARMECQVALRSLLERLPNKIDTADVEITWNSSIFLRGPNTLLLSYRSRPAS
jgi:cytochrome P450